MEIRNTAKAIILHDNKILVNKNLNSLGEMCYGLPHDAIYYDLPGGGQNQYETLEEAVKRECLEETGYSVAVDRLVAIYEEIFTDMEFRKFFERYAHKIHFVFLCHLQDMSIQDITEKDLDMLESEWVEVREMNALPLYPFVINQNLSVILETQNPIYFGSQRI